MRRLLQAFLSLNKQELRRLFFLIITIFILLLIKTILKNVNQIDSSFSIQYIPDDADFSHFDDQVAGKNLTVENSGHNNYTNYQSRSAISIQTFNPNFLDSVGWLNLGLSPKQTAVILKYRRKGGVFRNIQDLSRIYVLNETFLEKVKNHLVFDEPQFDVDNKKEPATSSLAQVSNSKKLYSEKADLNAIPDDDFVKTQILDFRTMKKILKFRDNLNGLDSLEQLTFFKIITSEELEVLKNKFYVVGPQREKIQINYANLEELVTLPGIGNYRARAIFNSRLRHGFFRNLEDLKNRKIIPDSTIFLIQNRISF